MSRQYLGIGNVIRPKVGPTPEAKNNEFRGHYYSIRYNNNTAAAAFSKLGRGGRIKPVQSRYGIKRANIAHAQMPIYTLLW